MSDPSSFIDVHNFDGSWTHDITTKFTLQEKLILFQWLLKSLSKLKIIKPTNQHDYLKGVKLVIDNIQQEPNYDSINLVYADDILAEICSKLINLPEIKRIDTLLNLEEQMSDMNCLGQCPSGRTTRLIQLYKCLNNI